MGDVITVPLNTGCYSRTRDVRPEPDQGWAYAWAYATVWAVTIAFYDNTKTF